LFVQYYLRWAVPTGLVLASVGPLSTRRCSRSGGTRWRQQYKVIRKLWIHQNHFKTFEIITPVTLDTFEFLSLKTLDQSNFLKLLHLNLILGINHFEFLKVYFIKCEMLNRLGLKDLKLFQFSNRTQSLILIYLMSMRCFV
jgi:hypothetical protein